MDLKENNILIEKKTSNPIIIDFGLAFKLEDTKNLDMETQRNIFFTYGVDYIPWCIDIAIITYINQLNDLTTQVTSDQLNTIVEDYFEKNPLINNTNSNVQYFSTSEIAEYKNTLLSYLNQHIGKSWAEFINSIKLASIDTWDNYAMAAIFYQIVCDSTLNNESAFIPLINVLKTILLASPENRMDADESLIQLNNKYNTIYKSTYRSTNIREPSQLEQIERNHLKTKMAILEREEQVQKILDEQ